MFRAVLFAFAALVACASAQCGIDGTSYTSGEMSLVFGATVGEATPLVFYMKDDGDDQAWFSTWTPANGNRIIVQDHGSDGRLPACVETGHYKMMFSADCTSLTLTALADGCSKRSDAYTGSVWTKFDVAVPAGFCTSYSSKLNKSDLVPRFSEESIMLYPATATGLYILSVGDVAIVFQRWTLAGSQVNIQDIMSVPEGYGCPERLYGQYAPQAGGGTCGVMFCGKADTCPERASLFHGIAANGYQGPGCPAPVEVITANSACSDGQPWRHYPYDCTSKNTGDQCMYCHGVANGKDVKLCLERDGLECNDIFRSVWRKAWCNLEFECPASTLSLSVFALLFAVLAALFN